MSIRTPFLVSLLALGCGLAACGGAPGEDSALQDEVGEGTDEIINGSVESTNIFNVAVYHKDNGVWFERPCSGTLLATTNGAAYILTAYHCVNLTNGPGDPNDVRLTTSRSPGRLTGQPPSTWITPWAVYFPQSASTAITGRDYAIIVAADTAELKSGLSSATVNKKPGLYFGSTADLVGKNLRAYGYGRNTLCTSVNGSSCDTEDSSSGVGILRTAFPFPVTSWGSNEYTFDNSSSAKVYHGDSGGPSTVNFAYLNKSGASKSWRVLVGIDISTNSNSNPTKGFAASSPNVPFYVETVLDRLYLSSLADSAGFLRKASDTSGATVTANSTSTTGRSMWVFDPVSKQMKGVTGLCLRGSSTLNSNVVAVTCGTSDSQKWTHTKNLQLKNVLYGTCVEYSGGNVVNQTCQTIAEQAWIFRPDVD